MLIINNRKSFGTSLSCSNPVTMHSQFIEQVQILMQVQQIKCAEFVFGKTNYMWLCNKRIPMIWMSPNDEFRIRQALTKVSSDQQVAVLKKLLTWLDNNTEAHCLKIPEIVLQLLCNAIDANLVNEVTFTRMGSFRNSLRRFSFIRGRVAPQQRLSPVCNEADVQRERSVRFNEVPVVYY